MPRVQIPKFTPAGAIELAGILYKPQDESTKGPALIVVHPGGGVKEQTANLYAGKLHVNGFTTICFDASHQGESGGEPRFLEDPSARVSDVWAVLDYVEKLPYVDPEKIAVVGICAGGGYAVAAAKVDHRLKAVATISMVNIGDGARKGWYGNEDPHQAKTTLDQIAPLLRAEADGATPSYAPYVPVELDDNTPNDMKEAHDYYLTPRCQHPNAQNKMLVRSTRLVLTFDAFDLVNDLLSQPVQVIVGEKAESKWHTDRLVKALGGVKEEIVVPNGTHMDFYDKLDYVDPSVEHVSKFMKSIIA